MNGIQIDITAVVNFVIKLVFILLTAYLIPYLKQNTDKSKRVKLEALYRTLVFAAEQIYGAGHGEEKLEYVIKELDERGIQFDRAEIEKTVYEELTRFKDEYQKLDEEAHDEPEEETSEG